MKTRTKKICLIISLLPLLVYFIQPIAPTFASWRWEFDYIDYTVQPLVHYRLYDPAGSGSYQEITETKSLGVKFDVEFEAGGGYAKGSIGTTVTAAETTRTYDMDNEDLNGIKKGDAIVGHEARFKIRVQGVAIVYYKVEYHVYSIEILEVDWNYGGAFALLPSDFKAIYGWNPPDPAVEITNPYSTSVTVSQGITKEYSYKLTIDTSQTIGFKHKFDFCGVKIGIDASCTFSQSYSIGTKIHLYDTDQTIKHYLNFGNPYSIGGAVDYSAQSMIAWFDAEYL